MPVSLDKVVDIIINDYNAMRNETITRLQIRYNIYQSVVVALIGVIAILKFGKDYDPTAAIALLGVGLPLIGFVVGQTVIDNQLKIMQLGNYAFIQLNNRVNALCDHRGIDILYWKAFRLEMMEKGVREPFDYAGSKVWFIFIVTLISIFSGYFAVLLTPSLQEVWRYIYFSFNSVGWIFFCLLFREEVSFRKSSKILTAERMKRMRSGRGASPGPAATRAGGATTAPVDA